MEKINGKVQMYAQIAAFLAIWIFVLVVTQPTPVWDLVEALKQVPTAIAIYAVLGIIFTKWIWRWSFLHPWLVKIPDLQGTWRGILKSDWIDPATGQGVAPIPMVLTIRQNFSNIRCVLMTKESSSHSVAADINFGLGGEATCLSYTYTNRSKATIRDRSPIHDGAAILKIIKQPKLALEGEYWTSRKTRGEMTLIFDSRDLAEKF